MKVLKALSDTMQPGVKMRGVVNLQMLRPTIRHHYYEGDYEAIAESLEQGMLFPIVVWETTVGEWETWAAESQELISPPTSLLKNKEKPVLLVMCGNNRLEWARENGYSHIDTCICRDKNDISRLCTAQRKGWHESSNG